MSVFAVNQSRSTAMTPRMLLGKKFISFKAVIMCFSSFETLFAKQRLQSAKEVDQTEAQTKEH